MELSKKKTKKNINKTIKYDNNESTLIIATLRWRIRERLKERNKQKIQKVPKQCM